MSQVLATLAGWYLRQATSFEIVCRLKRNSMRFSGEGFACELKVEPTKVCYVIDINVNEAVRRQGIGSRLLGGIHRFCCEQQIKPMVSPGAHNSDEARAFWRHHKYQPSDDDPDYWTIPDWRWDQLVAEQLAPIRFTHRRAP
jgi:GNAT superfamily N-acetyltransferase